jgi:DNA-binding transcriptional LysR family regulator
MNFPLGTTKQYETFLVAFETRSFHKAAEILGTKRQGVAKNIRALSNKVGKLFTTSAKGVEPTSIAIGLYPNIKNAFEIIMQSENSANFKETGAGLLRLGCPTYISNSILLDYMCHFAKKFPRVNIEVNNANRTKLIEKLNQSELDLIVEFSPIANEYLYNTKVLKNISYSFFASKEFCAKYNLTDKVQQKRLVEMPLVMYTQSGRILQAITEIVGTSQTAKQTEVSTIEIAYAMILKDMGIGFAPTIFLDSAPNSESIIRINVEADLPTFDLLAVTNKDSKCAISRTFVRELEEYLN